MCLINQETNQIFPAIQIGYGLLRFQKRFQRNGRCFTITIEFILQYNCKVVSILE